MKNVFMIEKNKIKIDEGLRRTGKDEMNLIELPFTLLAKRNPKGFKTIERHWSGKGEDKKERKFYKIITGSDKWGLPTFIGEEVYLACMELSCKQEFKDRKIYTTQYDLLKLLNWSVGGKDYKRLIKAFNQLMGISIFTNAFWDNENKTYKKIGFSILNNYEFFENEKCGRKSRLKKQSPLPLGYFRWDDVLFKSFQKGNIKTLNTSLYFSLNSYTAKRLYRFVDKKLYNNQSFEIDLFRLAYEKLEMTGNYKYPSKVKEKLKSALEELEERKIAKSCIKESKTESGYKVCFSPIYKSQILIEKESEKLAEPTETQAQTLVNHFHTKLDPHSGHKATTKEIQQAQDLLNQYGEEKSKQIINYSIKQAKETNFKMQYLGAIINYIPQALNNFKKEKKHQKHHQAQKQIKTKKVEQIRSYKKYIKQEIENYKNSISPEQYKTELKEVENNLLEECPWIKDKHWDGPVMQGTVEANYKDWLIEQGRVEVLKFEEWQEKIHSSKKEYNSITGSTKVEKNSIFESQTQT